MKSHDPLIDGDSVARHESLTVQAQQERWLEYLTENANEKDPLAKRVSEAGGWGSTALSREDLDLFDRHRNATREEREALGKSKKYKALVKKVRQNLVESGISEVLGKALFELMPDQSRVNYEALQFVIYGLSRIVVRPEVVPSAEVVSVLERLISDLSRLTIFEADEESIAGALAKQARSVSNARVAANPRTDKDKFSAANCLWDRWVSNPGLYKTKAAFSRDLIGKEFCADFATPANWIKRWAKSLPVDHPLQEKIAVKPRSK